MTSIILNIDTAQEEAIISISNGEEIMDVIINNDQKSHASILHSAISKMLKRCILEPRNLDAISISAGPGSYTGLRVGMAAAKGFCFALKIPMISINTLELMAKNAIISEGFEDIKYCPMIDARRLEVYTALYDNNLNVFLPPSSMVLDENSFAEELKKGKILFFGSGAAKFFELQKNDCAIIKDVAINPKIMASISYLKFNKKDYSNIIDLHPLYIKDFFTI